MPSDPTTWAELKTTLANWLARDDLSAAEIPEAIALAERRFQRTLFSPERETEATLSAVAEAVALPSDLWGIRAAYLATDPRIVLEPMTLAELRNTYAGAATGRPRNYAIRGETLVLGPAPDAIHSIKLTYIQTIPALGAGQPTNWLLTDHPDVYLFGSLHALHLLLADEERAALYDAKFRQAAEEVNRTAIRRTSGGAPIRIRPPISV
jgi:hypothetical protein